MLKTSLLTVWALAATALASPCTGIMTVPYTISSPGQYCVTAPAYLIYWGTSGAAITIAADDVVLDLQGRVLAGGAGSGSAAYGILAHERRWVTVRNGTVRGFAYGVRVDGSIANRIEDMTITANWYFGAWVEGLGAAIVDSRILATGGSTVPGNTVPIAVRAFGPGVTVARNTIHGVALGAPESGCSPSCEAVGIHIDAAAGSVVESNIVTRESDGPNSYAIWVNAGSPPTSLVVRDNVFTNWWIGIASATATKYSDNVFTGVDTWGSQLAADVGGNR